MLQENQIQFPSLGIDLHLDSTAFTLFGIDIQWYGLLIAAGLLLAMIYAFRNMRSYGVHPDRAMDAVIGGIIGAVIGARAYYVILEWDNYAGDWKRIFNLRQGGLAIYGGLIGALLVGCLVAKLRKVKILPLLDICGAGFLLGQGIGRWGNFFNQEAFGCNTNSVFGMTGGRIQYWISEVYPTTNFYTHFGEALDVATPVHPCFLYESIWCLIGFVVLAVCGKKCRMFDGQIFLMYIGWYGLGRFFIEGLRVDSLVIGNMRISQMIAAICVVLSVILLIVIGGRVKRMGGDYLLYKDTAECKAFFAEIDEKRNSEKKQENKTTQETEPIAEPEAAAEQYTEETESTTAEEPDTQTDSDAETDNA